METHQFKDEAIVIEVNFSADDFSSLHDSVLEAIDMDLNQEQLKAVWLLLPMEIKTIGMLSGMNDIVFQIEVDGWAIENKAEIVNCLEKQSESIPEQETVYPWLNIEDALPTGHRSIEVMLEDGTILAARYSSEIYQNERIVKRFNELDGAIIEGTFYRFKEVRKWRDVKKENRS